MTMKSETPVVQPCLVRRGSARWFWTNDLLTEVWDGPFKTIDEAISDVEIARSQEWYPVPLDCPVYVGLGTRNSKADREEFGTELTHQIDPDKALKIYLPNVFVMAAARLG